MQNTSNEAAAVQVFERWAAFIQGTAASSEDVTRGARQSNRVGRKVDGRDFVEKQITSLDSVPLQPQGAVRCSQLDSKAFEPWLAAIQDSLPVLKKAESISTCTRNCTFTVSYPGLCSQSPSGEAVHHGLRTCCAGGSSHPDLAADMQEPGCRHCKGLCLLTLLESMHALLTHPASAWEYTVPLGKL